MSGGIFTLTGVKFDLNSHLGFFPGLINSIYVPSGASQVSRGWERSRTRWHCGAAAGTAAPHPPLPASNSVSMKPQPAREASPNILAAKEKQDPPAE